MTNSYFDIGDLEVPIKTLDDYIIYHQVDINERKMQEVILNRNDATFNDKMVQFSDDLEQGTRTWISFE